MFTSMITQSHLIAYAAGLIVYAGLTAWSMHSRHGKIDWSHMIRHIAIFTVALIVSAYTFSMLGHMS